MDWSDSWCIQTIFSCYMHKQIFTFHKSKQLVDCNQLLQHNLYWNLNHTHYCWTFCRTTKKLRWHFNWCFMNRKQKLWQSPYFLWLTSYQLQLQKNYQRWRRPHTWWWSLLIKKEILYIQPVQRGQSLVDSSNDQPGQLDLGLHSSSLDRRSPKRGLTGPERQRPAGLRWGGTVRTWHSGCARWEHWCIDGTANSIFLLSGKKIQIRICIKKIVSVFNLCTTFFCVL